jgi:hypothetical protein
MKIEPLKGVSQPQVMIGFDKYQVRRAASNNGVK